MNRYISGASTVWWACGEVWVMFQSFLPSSAGILLQQEVYMDYVHGLYMALFQVVEWHYAGAQDL
jgi:hypothetical protein